MTRVFSPKPCRACTRMFQPFSPSMKLCPDCKEADSGTTTPTSGAQRKRTVRMFHVPVPPTWGGHYSVTCVRQGAMMEAT